MKEQNLKRLNDSRAIRWGALAIVAFTMMAAYYVNDVVAPLKTMLETDLKWDSSEFGLFTGAYSFLNVFFLMLIWGGLILDRFGIRFTGKLATVLMVLGTGVEYYAMTGMADATGTILGYKVSVFVASAGYSVFGVGAEVAGITVTKMIAKWFRGKEMATAMGTGSCGFAGCVCGSYPNGTCVRNYDSGTGRSDLSGWWLDCFLRILGIG
mgnify:CR=1 FL=1